MMISNDVLGERRLGGRVGGVLQEAVATAAYPFPYQSRQNRKTVQTNSRIKYINNLGGRER